LSWWAFTGVQLALGDATNGFCNDYCDDSFCNDYCIFFQMVSWNAIRYSGWVLRLGLQNWYFCATVVINLLLGTKKNIFSELAKDQVYDKLINSTNLSCNKVA